MVQSVPPPTSRTPYARCKRYGTIVPPVRAHRFATWHEELGIAASMTVTNPETAPITLDATGISPLSATPGAPLRPPAFAKRNVPITVAPKSDTAIGLVISTADVEAAMRRDRGVYGFLVYYRGSCIVDGTTFPVIFSCAIRVADEAR